MPHQNVTNTIQCNINYFMGNNNAANVFHVKATGPITSTLLTTLNNIIQAWLTAHWKPLAAADWSAAEVILTGLNSLFDPRISFPISPPIVGTALGSAMPANVTLAVKEDVGRRGKGIAGRWFWVGFTNGQVTDNTVQATPAADIVAALNSLAGTIEAAAGFEGICVPHLVVGGSRPPTATSDVITGFLLTDTSIDTQKDRLPFHKKHKRFPVA